MFATRSLLTALLIAGLSPAVYSLSLEQSQQFKAEDYILNEGITIEYKGQEQVLYFVDNGQPYHYGRIQREADGDLFRWVEFGEMKQEKYVKYVAKLKEAIPEVIVRAGDSISASGKSAPDTICDLVYDSQTGKPKNVYLVDFESQAFAPVLKQAASDLQKELKQPVTIEQAILLFYRRCSSEHYPLERIKQDEKITTTETSRQEAETEEPKLELAKPETGEPQPELVKPENEEESADDGNIETATFSAVKETRDCAKTDDDVYKIANDVRRDQRLSSFVSQLELEYSWNSEADSFSRLFSLINIAYPIFVHYELLNDELKKRFALVIDKTYDMSDKLYEQLPCEKRNQINTIFKNILGKTK